MSYSEEDLERIDAIALDLINAAVADRQARWLSDEENEALRAQLALRPTDPARSDEEFSRWWNGVLDIVESAADSEAAEVYADPT